jgi:hypothetical protein
MQEMKQKTKMSVISQLSMQYRFEALMLGLVSSNEFLIFLIDAGLNRMKENIRITNVPLL